MLSWIRSLAFLCVTFLLPFIRLIKRNLNSANRNWSLLNLREQISTEFEKQIRNIFKCVGDYDFKNRGSYIFWNTLCSFGRLFYDLQVQFIFVINVFKNSIYFRSCSLRIIYPQLYNINLVSEQRCVFKSIGSCPSCVA